MRKLTFGTLAVLMLLSAAVVRLTNVQAQAPKKARVLFISDRDGPVGLTRIYLVDADGMNQRSLTNPPTLADKAVWSRDGTKIFFNAETGGNWEIYVMAPNGAHLRNLTNHPAVDGSWGGFTVSPDGQQIAFTSNRDGGGIYVIDADGKNPRKLIDRLWERTSLSWSPDGQKIALATDEQIFVMDTNGANLQLIRNGRWPAWSPDGRRIAFVSVRFWHVDVIPHWFEPGEDIYVMDADGRNPRNLTNNPVAADGALFGGSFGGPAWSPDGRKVVFPSGQGNPAGGGPMRLYVMDADGGKVRRLTANAAFGTGDVNPHWFDPAFALAVSAAGRWSTTWGWLKKKGK